jgi:arabinogalactan oligomer / maltooligosaccharide transport system substrate-binding protein
MQFVQIKACLLTLFFRQIANSRYNLAGYLVAGKGLLHKIFREVIQMSRSKFIVLILLVLTILGSINGVMAQDNTLVIWADENRAVILQGLAEQVSADLGITLDIVEQDFGGIRDQLSIAGPVGEGPDILLGAHDWLGQLVTNGSVAPINLDSVADNFLPFTLAAFNYDGVQYGLPLNFENIALIRNVDLVPTAPATWQEVRTIAEAFAEVEGGPYAFAVQSGDAYHHYPILSAFGGYTFGVNENGSYNPADVGFASEGGLAAAQWLSDMYKDGLLPIVGGGEILPLFESGQLAMWMTGPWSSADLTSSGLNYSIDPLPGAEGGLENGIPFSGVQGFMISAYIDPQKALLAEIFLTEYVATLEVQQALFDIGLRPPAFIGVDTSADPNVAGFIAAGQSAIPMPSIPEMGATWAAAGNAYTLISQGEDPVETFNNAQQQVVDAIALSQSTARIVGLPGSLQDEAGCAADWDPACENTFMADDDGDGIYTLVLTLPAGDYEYKVAMNGSWDENYGPNGEANSASNITLSLAEETEVTFTYDDSTHIVTDSVNNP